MGRNQRKWRNILLDLNFQLSFTLLMVFVAAALLLLLGVWVKNVAHESTLVGLNRLEPMCEELRPAPVPPADAPPSDSPPADPAPADPAPDTEPDDEPETGDAKPADADPDGDSPDGDSPDGDRPRTKVVIENTSMELEDPAANEPVVADVGPATAENYQKCLVAKRERVDRLWSSYRLILFVLFGSSILLILGLAVHGLRMTHKVAGPLFKVGLYLAKMKRGTYDQVWNLRKGDQLTEFYEHFRAAHRELVAMQADDIAILAEVVAATEGVEFGEGAKGDEAREALAELVALLEAKTEGLKVPEDKRG